MSNLLPITAVLASGPVAILVLWVVRRSRHRPPGNWESQDAREAIREAREAFREHPEEVLIVVITAWTAGILTVVAILWLIGGLT